MKSIGCNFTRSAALALLIACTTVALHAQVGTVTGIIADQSGAVIPDIQITLSGPAGLSQTSASDGQGRYTFQGLPSGAYRLQITAEGFAPYEATGLRVTSGAILTHNIELIVAATTQEVTVADTMQLDVESANNASALVLKGSDLSALSDDPDDLTEDLQALAGPAAGPSGGEIFVDGFSGGKLPPKSAIREVRVNQNPFSAEYDRLGFGRIEILTKPGADRFRGEALFNFGDSLFNSRNPFVPDKPDYQRRMIEGNVGGAITTRSSFFLEAERRDIGETSVINALVLDPSFNVTPFRDAVLSPTTNTEASVRLDHQLNSNNTLVGRYEWEQTTQNNSGLDTFSLPSRAVNTENRDQVLQITETAVLNPNAIHELRFQYRRGSNISHSVSSEPAVQVMEAFSAGGFAAGLSSFSQNRSELTDMLTLSRNRHMVKLGGRVRGLTQLDRSVQNYNGMFTFTSLAAYRITELGLRDGLTPSQIRALGGGASQFSMVSGDPLARVGQVDAGVFVQDDWRVLPQLTLTAGLRYEVQNNIGDRSSFALRIGFAWAPGGQGRQQARTVIRGGFGMFYDRVGANLTLEASRLDGVHQQQYLVPDPDFYPSIPPVSYLSANLQQEAIRVMDKNLRAPYTAQTALTIEHQLPKNTTVSLTYTNLRGVHTLRSRNINAPLPGTYNPLVPDSGSRPYGGGNLYLYESTGTFRQNQFIVNVNARVSPRLSLFGYYVWNKANSDTDGAGSFPANQYDLRTEYGRAGFDVRHRAFVGGSIAAPYGLSLSPFIVASSGGPFNITSGRDLNGDSLFNDRPAWATDLSRSSVMRTSYGLFDTDPKPGQVIIPRNIGNSPGRFMVNLRLSKSFGFGERSSSPGQAAELVPHGQPMAGAHGGHGGHSGYDGPSSGSRYSLTFSVSARNLFNTVNLAPPVGNLSSPSFGTSVALAGYGHHGSASANRTVELQVRFSF
jgi:Carboxypeptidase regulatory-like domain/TonB dependent receptor